MANNFIIENNFKFNNDEVKAEFINLRKQLINWFIQCNTQEDSDNDDEKTTFKNFPDLKPSKSLQEYIKTKKSMMSL